ncbi:hypothetical protein MRBLMR1_001093 [Neorhizobium sp. LMR1-1-1.1]
MGKFENLPKVGDRVKIVASDVVSHWNMHWANEVGARLSNGDLVYVSKVTPRYLDGQAGLTIAATPGGAGPRWTIDRFAPVDNATLSIEAGKFYKTRDGRKVGPMEKIDYTWPFLGAAEGSSKAYYNADGSCPYIPEDDLIAEWVDEPAARIAKASNDNAAAKPKFKVGDRVRIVRARLSHKKPHIGDEFVIQRETYKVDGEKTWGGEGAHGCVWLESELELAPSTLAIVALIENGQPKPATKPKIHADQASATAEAERLALAYPGQQFGVFILADSRIADEVITKTAVLRAA